MTPAVDLDSQLMLSVQRDDARSFGVLLERNRQVVLHYLTRMVRNEAIAEELAQDVFLRVYRSRRTYAPAAKFSTWLYRIATNVALNHFRDEKRRRGNVMTSIGEAFSDVHREPIDIAPLVEDLLVGDALAALVRQAVRELPPKQRAAVILHKYDEQDYRQIARILRTTPSAVKALMFRAYETLRARLGQRFPAGRHKS
jgi:RNA polymerase sigma-70 factor (ECF subfamily)